MRSRAYRRHHLDRMKKKAEFIALNVYGTEKNANYKLYNHLAFCSKCGHGCGNPRRCWGEITRQEIKAADKEKAYQDYLRWRASRW
jgi:hypothetical protein